MKILNKQIYSWVINLLNHNFCHIRLLTDVTYTLSLSIHHHHHFQTISHWPVQSTDCPSNINLVTISKCKQQNNKKILEILVSGNPIPRIILLISQLPNIARECNHTQNIPMDVTFHLEYVLAFLAACSQKN